MSDLAHFARSRFARRLTAGLLAFAVIMHLIAMQIGSQHQAARLLAAASNSNALALLHQICTSDGLVSLTPEATATHNNTSDSPDNPPAGHSHHFEKPCPFCSSASLTPFLQTLAPSFLLPAAPNTTAARHRLASPQARSPDLRHAPPHGPPRHA